jgi:CheY-like chemotaxis protein
MKPLKKMALVDDDEVFVFLTRKAIEKSNLVEVIKVFGNGLEALNFLKENSEHPEVLPELILLDLSMPIMDGWQFLDEFVKLNPRINRTIVIYICSSSISPRDIIKAREICAVSDYIIKPVTKEKLVEIIEKSLTEEEFDYQEY